MSKLFGGKDPFDDPFFTQPIGGMFGDKNPFNDQFFTNPYGGQAGSSKEIVIEELNPDDDTPKNSAPGKDLAIKNSNASFAEAESFSFRRVSYGGVNGMYYSSSIGKRTGSDGVVLLEIKEEDKTAWEALHTISKGIHEKGHSLTMKRNPDGREDSMQILHNLSEDELTNFEEAWKVNADRHLPGWNDGFALLENTGLPWTEYRPNDEAGKLDGEAGTVSSHIRSKKVVPINVE